jgi:hypothetical protein
MKTYQFWYGSPHGDGSEVYYRSNPQPVFECYCEGIDKAVKLFEAQTQKSFMRGYSISVDSDLSFPEVNYYDRPNFAPVKGFRGVSRLRWRLSFKLWCAYREIVHSWRAGAGFPPLLYWAESGIVESVNPPLANSHEHL